MVSWVDSQTLDTSEIGGVGNLEMFIVPHFVISVVYENAETTDEQIDVSIEWMLLNDH
jgi:hypothetical protein